MTETASQIETRSLETGKWGNLVMAIAGVAAAYLSRSDAILVDGLYSGVNFVSAIIAARIGQVVLKPDDRAFPWGYEAHEALYVTFRSLVLVGITAFAAFSAAEKIVVYATGGEVPTLVLGPIAIYAICMVLICFGLAAWHHANWRKTGRTSEILHIERNAAVIDGCISAGAGAALLGSALLSGTRLAFLVPVADSIIVLLLSAIILRPPIRMFRSALREVAGAGADPALRDEIRVLTQQALTDAPAEVLDVAITKVGRRYTVVPYVRPTAPLSGEAVDRMREALRSSYGTRLPHVRVQVLITGETPYA